MGPFDDVAEIYERSRHGYPSELRDHLVAIGALRAGSTVVDLGAGTGQLARLAAAVATDVVAVDPEPAMVRIGQQATAGSPAIRWVVAADRDVRSLLDGPIDLVLIGNAFHHMERAELLRSLDSLVESNGAVVVCSTSVPVWLQDAKWSVALRRHLTEELGHPVDASGTPDHDSDRRILRSSPFSVVEDWVFAREQRRSVDSIVGEVVSSASGALDDSATERLRSTLLRNSADGAVTENVVTTALVARRPAP